MAPHTLNLLSWIENWIMRITDVSVPLRVTAAKNKLLLISIHPNVQKVLNVHLTLELNVHLTIEFLKNLKYRNSNLNYVGH